MAKRSRISFDPEDPEMKRVIDEIAQEYDIPPGDVMNLATLEIIDAIAKGRISLDQFLEDSRLPRYKKRLNLSSLLKRFRNQRGG